MTLSLGMCDEILHWLLINTVHGEILLLRLERLCLRSGSFLWLPLIILMVKNTHSYSRVKVGGRLPILVGGALNHYPKHRLLKAMIKVVKKLNPMHKLTRKGRQAFVRARPPTGLSSYKSPAPEPLEGRHPWRPWVKESVEALGLCSRQAVGAGENAFPAGRRPWVWRVTVIV